MDFAGGMTYRMAFGLADRLRESDQENFPGRLRSNPAAGGSDEQILAEVIRQMAPDGQSLELVKEGVEDALAGRQPRCSVESP
jgi:hypothetical protein